MYPTGAEGVPARRAAPGRLAAAWYRVAFWFCLGVFGLSCLAWSLPASVLYPLLPRRLGQPLGQFMIMAGFRWFIGVMRATGVLRVDFTAVDRLRGERGLVIAANHPTMLDAVLLISRLPRVVCILKASLWDNLFLGGGARLAGYVRNDAPLPMIRRAAEAVREGRTLMIFPEGTRTARPPIGPFARSFAVMARRAGAPVQTLLIEADSPYLTKGWPLFRRPELPLVYRIRLGRRFEAPEEPQAFVAELEAYFRAELPRGATERPR
jgi:1-acyl-sn-glycerol-3-phosphate acyltransferase